MERNQTFSISSYSAGKGDCVAASNPSKSFGDIMDSAVRSNGGQNFWIYDAVHNNCQDMILSFLRAGGVLTDSLRQFVKQDVKSLLPKFVSDVAKKATDIAHGVDRSINGEGK